MLRVNDYSIKEQKIGELQVSTSSLEKFHCKNLGVRAYNVQLAGCVSISSCNLSELRSVKRYQKSLIATSRLGFLKKNWLFCLMMVVR